MTSSFYTLPNEGLIFLCKIHYIKCYISVFCALKRLIELEKRKKKFRAKQWIFKFLIIKERFSANPFSTLIFLMMYFIFGRRKLICSCFLLLGDLYRVCRPWQETRSILNDFSARKGKNKNVSMLYQQFYRHMSLVFMLNVAV